MKKLQRNIFDIKTAFLHLVREITKVSFSEKSVLHAYPSLSKYQKYEHDVTYLRNMAINE